MNIWRDFQIWISVPLRFGQISIDKNFKRYFIMETLRIFTISFKNM